MVEREREGEGEEEEEEEKSRRIINRQKVKVGWYYWW